MVPNGNLAQFCSEHPLHPPARSRSILGWEMSQSRSKRQAGRPGARLEEVGRDNGAARLETKVPQPRGTVLSPVSWVWVAGGRVK